MGILAALGVAGLGIAAMRRRREPVYDDAELPSASLEPVPAPAPVMEAATPVAAEPVRADREPAPRHTASVGNSATAILAASPLPQTPEERYELLDAMAAAAPDEGNPFTSRKGRLRRARLQLQHRENEEKNGRGGSFDFRTYKPASQEPKASAPARSREYTQA